MDDSATFSPSVIGETGSDDLERISKLAILSLVVAILSIVSLIAPSMVWLAFLAALLGIVASFRVARDTALGGGKVAIAAIGLAALVGGWSITAFRQSNEKLYAMAGAHAKTYLQTLAAGNVYQAMEYRKEERNRQVTGTNLGLVYGTGESVDAMQMRKFLEDPLTQSIIDSGEDSNWELVSGEGVLQQGIATKVLVRMKNQASPESPVVLVALQRTFGEIVGSDIALWNVIEHSEVPSVP